jgi:hypothetical protein
MGCIGVLVGRRELVVPSPPARVGNLAQACTDRQTPNTPGERRVDGNTPGERRVDGNTPGRRRVDGNTPGRRRVAGHGFSRGTAAPHPRPLPPRARSRFGRRRRYRGGRGRGGGRRKPPLKRWPVTRREHGNRSAPWGRAEQGRPQGFHQDADALRAMPVSHAAAGFRRCQGSACATAPPSRRRLRVAQGGATRSRVTSP